MLRVKENKIKDFTIEETHKGTESFTALSICDNCDTTGEKPVIIQLYDSTDANAEIPAFRSIGSIALTKQQVKQLAIKLTEIEKNL